MVDFWLSNPVSLTNGEEEALVEIMALLGCLHVLLGQRKSTLISTLMISRRHLAVLLTKCLRVGANGGELGAVAVQEAP